MLGIIIYCNTFNYWNICTASIYYFAMEVNPDYALWQTLGALCVGLGLSKGMELVANNQTWACKRNPFVSQLKQWPAEWLEKNFRCLLDDFMTTYQLLQMKDDEVVSSYHAKGCFLNENLSTLGYLHPNCRALASLFGVVPCFIRGFRRSLDNKKSRKLCCVVKRCRVSFGKSKTPGPGNDLQRLKKKVASAWRGAWLVLDAELWPQRRFLSQDPDSYSPRCQDINPKSSMLQLQIL